MRSIADKHMRKGKAVVTCILCGNKVMGEDFYNDFMEDKMSAWQKFQLNALVKIARAGAKVLGGTFDDTKEERMRMLLTVHFSRSVRNGLHRKVLTENLVKCEDDIKELQKFLEIDERIIKFVT